MGKKREEAAAAGPGAALPAAPGAVAVGAPVSLDQLEQSRGYDERIGAVRGFTRDNPARAALAVRDMIKANGK
jgi:flagellar M-ring protein FliF